MNFLEALQNLRQGRAMRRKFWEDQPQLNFIINDGILVVRNNTKHEREISFELDDVLADDWELFEQRHTFFEAIPQVLDGKAAYRHSKPYYAVIFNQRGKLEWTNTNRGEDIGFDTEEVLATDWIVVDRKEIRM